MFSLVGCNTNNRNEEANDINNENKEENMKKYYSIEDFKSITIGESSIRDVLKIALPINPIQMRSYGALCEYPAENGRYIIIKGSGKDLIVFSIEEVDDSAY